MNIKKRKIMKKFVKESLDENIRLGNDTYDIVKIGEHQLYVNSQGIYINNELIPWETLQEIGVKYGTELTY
jgi:hypothetical protein